MKFKQGNLSQGSNVVLTNKNSQTRSTKATIILIPKPQANINDEHRCKKFSTKF